MHALKRTGLALLVLLMLLSFFSGCQTPEDQTPPVSIPTSDPYVGVSREEFYANYTPANNYMDAYYRSQHGFLSGSLTVPDQEAVAAEDQPMDGELYVRNTDAFYSDDGRTYTVVDSSGNKVMEIYRDGGYITLEEVAAYMYAFGGSSSCLPANYTSKKSGDPDTDIWGEYLRLNHSHFTGNTKKYRFNRFFIEFQYDLPSLTQG